MNSLRSYSLVHATNRHCFPGIILAHIARLCFTALLSAVTATAQLPSLLKHSIPAPRGPGQVNAKLGYHVAVDGNLTVVGAPLDDTNQPDAGLVKIFDT